MMSLVKPFAASAPPPRAGSARNACAAALLGLILLAPAHGQEIVPMREWLRDVEKLYTEVLDPLTEKFASEECVPGFGYHSDLYFQHLQRIRSELNSTSYLLFREMVLITAQDVGRFYHVDPNKPSGICRQWDAWSGIRRHIDNKIEFIGNIFAMSGWRQ